jgi:hypothetical protein
MKNKFLLLLVLILPFLSCKNEDELRIIEQLKEAKKQEQVILFRSNSHKTGQNGAIF